MMAFEKDNMVHVTSHHHVLYPVNEVTILAIWAYLVMAVVHNDPLDHNTDNSHDFQDNNHVHPMDSDPAMDYNVSPPYLQRYHPLKLSRTFPCLHRFHPHNRNDCYSDLNRQFYSHLDTKRIHWDSCHNRILKDLHEQILHLPQCVQRHQCLYD